MHASVCLYGTSIPFAYMFYCHLDNLFISGCTVRTLACSFVPAAGYAQPSTTSGCFLSCIAHCWPTGGKEHFITTACRVKQTDGKIGSWFKKIPFRKEYPIGCEAQCLVFVTHCDVEYVGGCSDVLGLNDFKQIIIIFINIMVTKN